MVKTFAVHNLYCRFMQRTIFQFCTLRQPSLNVGDKIKFQTGEQQKKSLSENNILKNIIIFSIIIMALFSYSICRAQTVDFTISNKTGCVPLSVNFTDISSGGGGIVSRTWDLGYPIPGLQPDPTVGANYLTAGTYTITLTVTFANGVTRSKSDQVIVHPIPVADFATSDTLGCSPLTVRFKDLSTTATGSITQWYWDLDVNGATSNLQNPTQTFSNIGDYRIILFVKNSWGCVSQNTVKFDYIRVINRPNVNFTLSPQNTCKDTLTVSFNNTSINAPNYFWNFGDGATDTVRNPVHFYASAGSYPVTLRSVAASGCEGNAGPRTVNIGTPKATIIDSPDTVCERTPTIFRGSVIPGATATGRWVFKDRNVTVSGNQVTYSFDQPGQYEVLFIGMNGWLCADTVQKSILVKAGPKPLFTVDTARSCRFPFVVQATNLTQDRTLKFTWNFGDGTTFDGIDPPPHTYNRYDNFTITLTARDTSIPIGCVAQLAKPDTIKITRPSVSISQNPASSCQPPKPFTFTASTNFIEPVIQYLWRYGDGTTDTTSIPTVTHTYTTSGTFPVSVTAVSRNNCSALAQTSITLRDTCPIILPPQPAIIATGSCNPCNQVTFKDTVSNATVTSWDLGDNTFISTNVPNPVTHLFPLGTDTFTVIVTRKNNTTGQISSTSIKIDILCPTDPLFTASRPIACINDSIHFTPVGLDSNLVSVYTWNFGDGNGRVLNNPPYTKGDTYHKYSQLGSYPVRLSTRDRKGCNKTSLPITITVQGPKPDFTSLLRTSCDTTFIASFKDSTALNANIPIAKWQWNFGDGFTYETTKDTIIPKRYRSLAVRVTEYPVTLTVTDSVGCSNTLTKPRYVRLYRPKAEFSSRDTVQCNRYSVFLSSSTQAVNPTYTWHLGDGTTKTGVNPSHTYPGDGQYDVKLVVTDENGCTDSIHKSKYIKFIHPKSNISIRDTGQCWPVQIRFSDSSQYANSYLWNFGDGRSLSVDKNPRKNYAKPGIYTVTLIVTGPNECKDTSSQEIKIKGATGELLQGPITGCKPYDATMHVTNKLNISSFIWDYGDGTPVAPKQADSVVIHTYKVAGRYLPNVIFISAEGCSYSSEAKDTLIVDSAKALFSATPITACTNDSVPMAVINLSKVPAFSAITKYTWDWGNGQTSNAANPAPPVYKQPGVYDIQLAIASKYGCRDTFRLPALVKIFSQPILSISGKDSACQQSTLSFAGTIISADSISTMKWIVNGNTAGTGNTITLPFNQAGTFPVSLNVVTRYGCNATINKPVTVVSLPKPNAGPDTTVCINSSFRLNASAGLSYTWTPSATLTESNTATPLARPSIGVTKYAVTALNGFGCSGKDTVTVKVDDSVHLRTVTPVELCKGHSIILRASANNSKFLWSPAGGLSSAAIANPAASPSDTTLYTVVSLSNNTCPNDTGLVLVNVNPVPKVAAKADPLTTTPGNGVSLVAESAGDALNYQWSPPSKLLNSGNKTAVWRSPDTTTTFTIVVRNQAGCTASADVEVRVRCTESSFNVPNAFNPSGKNSRFRPLGMFKSDPIVKQFSVFNRWGQRVYHIENSKTSQIAGWDGTVNGKLQDSGTYVWFIQVDCVEGSITKKGTVILIR